VSDVLNVIQRDREQCEWCAECDTETVSSVSDVLNVTQRDSEQCE